MGIMSESLLEILLLFKWTKNRKRRKIIEEKDVEREGKRTGKKFEASVV